MVRNLDKVFTCEMGVKIMKDSVLDFYDELSEDYHLIFEDWDASVRRHSKNIDKVIQECFNKQKEKISLLDCSCGIGTQAIGLALSGYNVHATDLSPKAVERAQKEAKRLGAKLSFGVADFRDLNQQIDGLFDVIITCDNALPHLLNENDLLLTFHNIRKKLKNDGLFLASIRDYDQLIIDRTRIMSPYVIDAEKERRIVFQVWDWHEGGNIYTVNHFIIRGNEENWDTTQRSTLYRAISKQELKSILEEAGFSEVAWHMPEDTGYYQPIITAIKH